ncbi:MAG TPA: heme o synthase [Longimicrobiales bacterium]|nr:heme o synthase [Longimicrobiales bacterium]
MSAAVRAYFELTKPGITLFIGITAGAGFITALGGWGMPGLLMVTLLATMLMSAGAATLNQVVEQRWDAMMARTASRPIPSGLVSERSARVFGWALSGIGLVLSLALLPWATALFLVLCHVSYVFAYTPLKRRTPLCTLTGAIPGALPVLAGWAATGQPIDVVAIALTGVLFMWQIPHFLAIGWMARDDYASAGCPMLGVVESTGRASARISLFYASAMLVCALVVGVMSDAGAVFLATALATGGAYVLFAWRFVQRRDRAPARQLFFSSLLVLPILLGALMLDLAV